MTEPTFPLQVAVVTALKAYAPLAALVGAKIYDRVPEGTAAPYCKLSGWQEINDDTDCSDASEVFFDIQCFSTAVGRPAVAKIAGAVKAALNKTAPALPGLSGAEILHRSTLYFTESDGVTERAIVNFHALPDSD